MPRDSRIGTTLAGYRIEAGLGRGGMGIVYCATHVHLDRRVALKLLPPKFADNEDFRRRFIRESRTAASLHHPGIVTVYDAGESDGLLYIAMHLVEGVDLGLLLRRARVLEPAQALWILRQVASALDAAHARGLVHRDVKPANIMVDREGAYLTDFGLTKRTTVTGSGSTTAGVFLGTIDYAAPEQIAGTQLDGRTDVYALGCVLYQCLTGSVPFPRESAVAVMFAHMKDEPPAVSARRPDLDGAIDAVVKRALAKERDDRYSTCSELIAEAGEAFGVEPALGDLRLDPQPRAPAVDQDGESDIDLDLDTEDHGDALGTARLSRSRAPVKRSRSSARGRRVAAALALLVAGAGVAAILLSIGGGGDDSVDQSSAKPVAQRQPQVASKREVKVGRRPFGLAVNSDGVWVALTDDDQLQRLDGRSGRPLGDPIVVGDGPLWVTAAARRVWVTNVREDSVTRIDPETGEVLNRAIPVGDGPSGMAAGPGTVWVANENADTVSAIPTDNPALPRPQVKVGDRPRGLATTAGVLWVTLRRDAAVVRINTATLLPIGEPIPVGHDPQGIAVARGIVFVTNSDDDSVSRIQVRTGRPIGRATRVGRAPYGIAYGLGYVWVANSGSDTVTRLDPRTGRRVGRPIPVGDQPVAVRVANGAVWVSNDDSGTVTRIKP